jgi:hypothetical protein
MRDAPHSVLECNRLGCLINRQWHWRQFRALPIEERDPRAKARMAAEVIDAAEVQSEFEP